MLADEIPHGDCDDCTLINDCCVQTGDKFENCCQNAFYKWLKKISTHTPYDRWTHITVYVDGNYIMILLTHTPPIVNTALKVH